VARTPLIIQLATPQAHPEARSTATSWPTRRAVGLLRPGAAAMKKNEQQQRQKPPDFGQNSPPIALNLCGAQSTSRDFYLLGLFGGNAAGLCSVEPKADNHRLAAHINLIYFFSRSALRIFSRSFSMNTSHRRCSLIGAFDPSQRRFRRFAFLFLQVRPCWRVSWRKQPSPTWNSDTWLSKKK
jgi:hypothetical protein